MACTTEEERKVFIITWSIKDIFYLKYSRLNSESFYPNTKDDTSFYLDLDMRGDNNNFISFYIWKTEENDTTEKDFELSMLAADGSPLIARKETKCLFTNQKQGFSNFGSRNEIFEHRKEEFLRNDTLILRCKIWDSDMTENVHFLRSICPDIHRANFVWTLKEFSTLTPDDAKTAPVKMPTRRDPLMDMKLFLMRREGQDKIQINLVNPKGSIVEYCSCSVSALDISGRVIESVKKEFLVEDDEDGNEGIIELPPFLSKRILMEQKDRYLPKDTLSLACEFSCYCGNETDISEGTYYGYDGDNLLKPQLSSNVCDDRQIVMTNPLGEDLNTLLQDRILCDVKLQTTTETFHVHKNILCARSSVFKTMFTNDTKASAKECVEIPDVDSDTMRQMLRYVYADTLNDLQWEIACKLYAAAVKYDIFSLKDKCSNFMKMNLCSKNACEALITSDLHQDVELKTSVQDYILNHVKEIIITDEWKDLMKNHSQLAAKTMYHRLLRDW
ncbi:BTB and MATH domain-containing protein 43 [Caerostris extrusa]|uniref:BTB and MATH domain-containing protein 43 n=1 Tax=Caerostris extrusa TaxID=172846 RepID=A0AAV4RAF1_CAEEX|nr:BTB and MATH domain-containing protein 43 [Caerostris extrusa]